MNWIRPERRLAIYLRDGLSCCYCGEGIEAGIVLTMDHIRPYSKGGTNDSHNLVTCCRRCNSSRGNRSWRKFAEVVAQYLNHGVDSKMIINRILASRRRNIDVIGAKKMIARRDGFSAAVKG